MKETILFCILIVCAIIQYILDPVKVEFNGFMSMIAFCWILWVICYIISLSLRDPWHQKWKGEVATSAMTCLIYIAVAYNFLKMTSL